MEKYQKVKIINNKYISDGIKKDVIGYILEIYDENYCEVEFLAKDGSIIAVPIRIWNNQQIQQIMSGKTSTFNGKPM